MTINRPHIIVRKKMLPCLLKRWHERAWWKRILGFFCFRWIFDIIAIKHITVEFYDSFVIKKWGWWLIGKHEEKCMFPKVLSSHVDQSFWGWLLRYGTIRVDAIGKWDVDLVHVKRPQYVCKYLNNHFISAKEIQAMRQTVVTN